VPYGYRLHEKHLILGLEEEIRIVRWLFTEYAFHGATLGALADQLNRDGVPSPSGRLWGRNAVHKILTRPVYYGVMIWNRRHGGKFYEVKGGEVVTAKRTRKSVQVGEEQDWFVCEAPHLAVVDRALFDRVQRKLVENRDSCTPNRGRRLYLLTGLLSCDECGWPMHGIPRHTKRPYQKPKHNGYVCGNYNTYRKRGGCLFLAVDESLMLDVVAEKVTAHFLRPEIREALREEIRRQEQAEREGRESPTASLNARIAALDKKISEGTEKWLSAPASLTDLIGRKLEEWRQERARLHQERRELSKPAPRA
jgi:site-specific DNA recombinase